MGRYAYPVSGGSRSTSRGSFTTALATYQTALSVAGSGVLTNLLIKNADISNGNNIGVKVTVDGDAVFEFVGDLVAGQISPTDVNYIANIASAAYYGMGNVNQNHAGGLLIWIEFKSSLLIQLKGNGSYSGKVFWEYSKD